MHADTPAKKLVARRKRRERVYNRAGEPSVTFCGKEEKRRERALIFVKKSEQAIQSLLRRGSGRRIRTLTDGVRVRRATFTQFR